MANTFTPEQIAQILEEFFKVVGTRQYVGARYVPIFGRKGEDSIEWDNTGAYEPLTIVLYQGNSYTSRQYVPVGIDITNQAFWAETGNYNAQIEEYRRETAAALQAANQASLKSDAAQADIDNLLPKSAFSSEATVKGYIDARVSEFDNLLPKSAFSSEATVKGYIDASVSEFDDALAAINYSDSGFNPIDLLINKDLTRKVGTLPSGYVYQGMTIIDGYMYVIGYPAVNQNSTLFKIDLVSLEVVNAYDFGVYIHGNSVSTYNNLILVTDTMRGYYTFNTELELLNYYNPYAYGTTFRNASFCVFSDNIHAMSQISGHAGANVFYKDCDGVFTSYNLVKNESIGAYGYQDMCQCFNLVALLCSYANDNKLFLFKYDGTVYMEIPFPALDIEFEGIWFDSATRVFHITGAEGSYYTFDCASFLSSNKTNITHINDVLYSKNDYWRAPANAQGLELGDFVQCTNTDGTRTVYFQRYIRKPTIANTGGNALVWQLNTGAFLAGTYTGGGGLRANIPVFSALHGTMFLGFNYSNAPTVDRQAINTIYVYDGTQTEPILRLANLNNLDEAQFIETMKPFIDYMITSGVLSTSSNVFGAIRPANDMQGVPEICYAKVL